MIRTVRRELEERLRRGGVPEPEVNAELLLAKVLRVGLGRLRAIGSEPLPDEARAALEPLVARRLQREPVQYILGSWPFLELELEVGPGVLIPRPETEEWVDRLCALLRERFGDRPFRFADIGTGTGAIGLAIAARFPAARGLLIDRSPEALAIARRNLDRLPVTARLCLVRGDLLEPLVTQGCDLLVSNPPYVARGGLPGLQPEVGLWEPLTALDGGPTGTELPCRLLRQIPRVLAPGGIVAIEHGHGQRAELTAAAPSPLRLLEAGTDLGGRERWLFWDIAPTHGECHGTPDHR